MRQHDSAEELGLLDDIHAAPRDDAPRLIYADWLDDRRNPRGEFIRAQCELAKLEEDDPREGELNRASNALWRQNWREWLGEVPHGFRYEGCRRGFPQIRQKRRIHRPELLRDWNEESLPRLGVFEAVTLELCKTADIDACLSSKLLERVNKVILTINRRITEEVLRVVARAPMVLRLESLWIRYAFKDDCRAAFEPVLGEKWEEVIVHEGCTRKELLEWVESAQPR